MKSFSNTYIFTFSAVMVIIVASLLSFTAIKLKPLQEKNIEIAKKLDILKSVHKGDGVSEADSKNTYVEGEYNKYITESFVVDVDGNKKEGVDAFGVNLKVELSKEVKDQNLPVFVFTGEGGDKKFIFPVRGKGLWGPIWGYIALNDDFNSIYGVIFDHEGETPGLGAEISTLKFQDQFKGKQIFKDSKFVSVAVEKGNAPDSDLYTVDAISGGTITSKGLESMVTDCLSSYENFLTSKKQ